MIRVHFILHMHHIISERICKGHMLKYLHHTHILPSRMPIPIYLRQLCIFGLLCLHIPSILVMFYHCPYIVTNTTNKNNLPQSRKVTEHEPPLLCAICREQMCILWTYPPHKPGQSRSGLKWGACSNIYVAPKHMSGCLFFSFFICSSIMHNVSVT